MRKIHVFLLILLALLAACEPNVEELTVQAKNKMGEGAYREAISLLEKVVEQQPQNHDAMNTMGVAYFNLEEHARAIEFFNKALENYPQDYKYYYNRGNVHRKINQPEKAIADYSQALSLDTTHYEVYLNRGLSLVATNQLAPALQDFEKAAELSQEADKLVYYYRAKAYLQAEELEKAKESLTVALAIDPSFAEAYYESALVEFARENAPSPEMCTLLERAIDLGYKPAVDFAKLYCD